ncbi:DUF4240 domain-containing protein [Amycolatopsis sp. NPDC059657]|uniref:DUF4240 domain-containing protein n=1 Tax=Amycolatopsis sp. NPDC059657 TaxID=3346899 RepID=UPI00366A68D1
MREHQFWRLIRQSQRGTNPGPGFLTTMTKSRQQVIRLRHSVEALPFFEIVQFHHMLQRIHQRANSWEMWTAFGIALGSMSEENFREAVSWLILQGRRRFTRAVALPDLLAELEFDEDEVIDAEPLGGIIYDIFVPLGNGDDVDDTIAAEAIYDAFGFVGSARPEGEKLSEDLPSLRARYPKLVAKHVAPGAESLPEPAVLVPKHWCPDLADQIGAP